MQLVGLTRKRLSVHRLLVLLYSCTLKQYWPICNDLSPSVHVLRRQMRQIGETNGFSLPTPGFKFDLTGERRFVPKKP